MNADRRPSGRTDEETPSRAPFRRRTPAPRRRAAARLLPITALSMFLVAGCLDRRLSITSEPSGAAVWVNDVEVGRTPVEASFTYYGRYEVQLEKDGYEPLRTRANAQGPIYEYPPFDLVATAIPADIETTIRWHFVLTPVQDEAASTPELEAALIERARALRARIE